MKNILIKTLIILCAVLMLQAIITSYYSVDAAATSGYDTSLINELDGVNAGQGQTGEALNSGVKAINGIIGGVINVIRVAGAAIAIVILMVIATKYIIASAGDRADIKKYAVNYVIGAMIFLGASAVLTLIQNFIEKNVTDQIS